MSGEFNIEVQPDQVADPYRLIENREFAEQAIAENVPAHFRDAEITDPQVQAWVEGLIKLNAESKFTIPSIRTGGSLLLAGTTGVGKTYNAYGAVRALGRSGLRCPWLFTTAADFYAQQRPGGHSDAEGELRRHQRIALLILDDIGASKASEWTEEINYRLINHRYEHELPTLITTNVPPRELANVLGRRVASRLGEMATIVRMVGTDRRNHGSTQ